MTLEINAPRSGANARRRIAGGLLILGASASIVGFFLPWKYAYWPPDRYCLTCQPETRSPANYFSSQLAAHYPPSTLISTVWLLLLIGLPLAGAALGVRLLARRQALRTRWKVVAIIATLVVLCATLPLTAIMSLTFMNSTAAVITQIGEPISLLAPLVALIASIMLPTQLRATR